MRPLSLTQLYWQGKSNNFTGDYFLNDEFGILMDYRLKGEPILEQSQPYRLAEARLFRVLQGSVTYSFNLEKFTVNKGMIIVVPSGTLVVQDSYTPDYVFQGIGFDDVQVPLKDGIMLVKLKEGEWEETEWLMQLLWQEAHQEPFNRAIISHLMNALVGIVEREQRREGNTPSVRNRSEEIYHQFLSLVNQYAATERKLDFYSDKLCLASHYLSNIISSVSHQSASEWITQAAVMEAKVQLLYTDKSIKQIAEDMNFNSDTFFCRYFRQATGLTPKVFRQQNRSAVTNN
ncbi:MAG: helix-turn-helix domain-containing protein [Prevotella sp.]|jgi:AraC family transcriptional activator of pobA